MFRMLLPLNYWKKVDKHSYTITTTLIVDKHILIECRLEKEIEIEIRTTDRVTITATYVIIAVLKTKGKDFVLKKENRYERKIFRHHMYRSVTDNR